MSALRSAIAPHGAGGLEILGDHPHRDAGAAGLAGRPIGDRLAAAEAAMGEQIVEARRAVAHQMREHLPLLLARQIRAGRRRGQIELRRIARMLGHGRRAIGSHASAFADRASGQTPRAARCAPPGVVVDHDGADQDVVQQPPALVEEADQQDQRRQHRDGDPEHDRMHRAEHEIGRRAVPGAHLDIHHPHADGGRARAAERDAVIDERPDHRDHRHQAKQHQAEAQRDDADGEDEHARRTAGSPG